MPIHSSQHQVYEVKLFRAEAEKYPYLTLPHKAGEDNITITTVGAQNNTISYDEAQFLRDWLSSRFDHGQLRKDGV